MARKGSARTSKPKATEEDAKLLAKLERMVARDPELEPGDALESLGADLVTQRRVRRLFEQEQAAERSDRRQTSGGSGHREVRALSSTKEARVTGPARSDVGAEQERRSTTAGMQARTSTEDETSDDESGETRHAGLPSPELLAELGRRLARLSIEAAEAEAGLVAKAVTGGRGEGQAPREDQAERAPQRAATNGSGGAKPEQPLPWVQLGLESTVSALRLQQALLETWFNMPAVRLALMQQSMIYNSMLQLAASNPLVKR